jgi:two-component system OmpR family response regulator
MDPLKLLMVDGDPFTLKTLKKKLEQEGYDVETAQNGMEACEFISENFYDVVITSLAMPGNVNGMDVLSAAKTKNSQTEVILLTARVTAEHAIEAMRKGAFDYLQEPINVYELIFRIEKVKSHQQLINDVQDLREAMDVTESNAAQTIQNLEMTVENLKNTLFEIKNVINNNNIDQGKRIDKILSMI